MDRLDPETGIFSLLGSSETHFFLLCQFQASPLFGPSCHFTVILLLCFVKHAISYPCLFVCPAKKKYCMLRRRCYNTSGSSGRSSHCSYSLEHIQTQATGQEPFRGKVAYAHYSDITEHTGNGKMYTEIRESYSYV
jgi:hypothetical protein